MKPQPVAPVSQRLLLPWRRRPPAVVAPPPKSFCLWRTFIESTSSTRSRPAHTMGAADVFHSPVRTGTLVPAGDVCVAAVRFRKAARSRPIRRESSSVLCDVRALPLEKVQRSACASTVRNWRRLIGIEDRTELFGDLLRTMQTQSQSLNAIRTSRTPARATRPADGEPGLMHRWSIPIGAR